jgi:hypothetical protein
MSVAGDIVEDWAIKPMDFTAPIGFVADPLNPRKFYISSPGFNIITSFYDTSRPTQDWFDLSQFPVHKPPKTFRILLVGDSKTVRISNYEFTPVFHKLEVPLLMRELTLPRQLELELNTLAALDDIPMNFEVLNVGHLGNTPLFLWPTYEVPDLVRKNDIDLVLILQFQTDESEFPFKYYYTNPINAEGIPEYLIDSEYLSRPPEERIRGSLSRKFLNICNDLKLVKIDKGNFIFDQNLFLKPELHDLLVEMYGKPLDILSKKLSTIKTSGGEQVRLLLCSTHSYVFKPNLEDPKIWVDVAKKYNLPFLNLNGEVSALRLSYFPLNEIGLSDHLNADGQIFFGRLLAHALIKDRLIPWVSPTPTP